MLHNPNWTIRARSKCPGVSLFVTSAQRTESIYVCTYLPARRVTLAASDQKMTGLTADEEALSSNLAFTTYCEEMVGWGRFWSSFASNRYATSTICVVTFHLSVSPQIRDVTSTPVARIGSACRCFDVRHHRHLKI